MRSAIIASPAPTLFELVMPSGQGGRPAQARHQLNPRPVLVSSAMDAAATLTRLRTERGWTGEELDARAGFQERYTGKLEQPEARWGKRGLHISPMWEIWAETLGVCLVIMTKEQARQVGAAAAPIRAECVRPGHV